MADYGIVSGELVVKADQEAHLRDALAAEHELTVPLKTLLQELGWDYDPKSRQITYSDSSTVAVTVSQDVAVFAPFVEDGLLLTITDEYKEHNHVKDGQAWECHPLTEVWECDMDQGVWQLSEDDQQRIVKWLQATEQTEPASAADVRQRLVATQAALRVALEAMGLVEKQPHLVP